MKLPELAARKRPLLPVSLSREENVSLRHELFHTLQYLEKLVPIEAEGQKNNSRKEELDFQ